MPRVPVRRRTTVILALLAAALAGCSSYPTLGEIAGEVNSTLEPQAFLEVGDTISVRFPQRPEWDHESRVHENGMATFLMLGDLQVVGLSVDALNRKLADAYKKQDGFTGGAFTAMLAQAAPREVIVIGEVHNPGAVPFGRGPLTFIEAIGRAGGPVKGSALLEEAMLVRWSTSEQRQRVWHLDANIDEWKSGVTLLLQPHDVIFVPNNGIDRVNVWVDKYIRQNLPLPLAIPIL